jgi:antitoxin HicB
MKLAYPAYVEQDGPGDWAVVFRDIPEAVTGGESPDTAWQLASDALAVALTSYPARFLPFPIASEPRPGERLISVPAIESAKLFIRDAMAKSRMSAADLARLAETDHKTIRRILALDHRTRMDELERILRLLGVRVTLMAA